MQKFSINSFSYALDDRSPLANAERLATDAEWLAADAKFLAADENQGTPPGPDQPRALILKMPNVKVISPLRY